MSRSEREPFLSESIRFLSLRLLCLSSDEEPIFVGNTPIMVGVSRRAPYSTKQVFRLATPTVAVTTEPNSIGQMNYADHINLPHRSTRETMNARNFNRLLTGVAVVAAWMLVPSAVAQRGRGPQGPQVVSPEVSVDRRITFRILAARAQTVRL